MFGLTWPFGFRWGTGVAHIAKKWANGCEDRKTFASFGCYVIFQFAQMKRVSSLVRLELSKHPMKSPSEGETIPTKCIQLNTPTPKIGKVLQ
eukprot:4598036-Amphidinium_carterae.1